VGNLLDMTQIESGSVQVQKEWQPLEEVVGGALNRLDARLVGRPIEVALPPDLPLVPFDPVLIEQVLVNLLKNAAEAMHDARPDAVDPVIRVVVRLDSGFVCISVVDQGPGVDEATAERLFEPFYSTKSDGMGMGLNICRSIIESHRGRLWVVNNVESDGHITGATFHCSLPIGEPDGPSNGGSEAPTPQTVTGEL